MTVVFLADAMCSGDCACGRLGAGLRYLKHSCASVVMWERGMREIAEGRLW